MTAQSGLSSQQVGFSKIKKMLSKAKLKARKKASRQKFLILIFDAKLCFALLALLRSSYFRNKSPFLVHFISGPGTFSAAQS
jgi:hypothetical protein